MRGLETRVREALGRRLLTDNPRPIVIALSGGGDSLALTLLADAWAHGAGRDLLILTVDHGLQRDSPAWTRACAATAERLGRPFRALAWGGDKPATGLPAAARRARHALLAEAAREAGARVILMGHTADDLVEGAAMREAGSTTPDPLEWAPSPAWPQGRGVFVLRPLLAARRAELRGWLNARGEAWIDDPANADPSYARSRARLARSGSAAPPPAEPRPLPLAAGLAHADGVLRVPRQILREAAPDDARRMIAIACVCAGGGERLPSSVRAVRLAAQARADGAVAATLAGARLEADGEQVRIFREAGEAARGGLPAVGLQAGRETVWDGRFAITARAAGLEVRRLAGLSARLEKPDAERVRALPAAARGALPALVAADGSVRLSRPEVEIVPLVAARLAAAAGLVAREPA